MRMDDERESENVEDRRGESGRGGVGVGKGVSGPSSSRWQQATFSASTRP